MRRLNPVPAACGLLALGLLLAQVTSGCSGEEADGDGDGDADGDSDADCDPVDTVCGDDFDCCSGLSCACEVPPCAPEDFTCTVCQPLGEQCNTSLECCRDGVCAGHTCVPVFDRDYEVQITFTDIYARNDRDGGNYWDPQPCDATDTCTPEQEAERAPDPYVVVKIDETRYETEPRQNELASAWTDSFIAHVANESQFSAWIYDDDPDQPEDAIVLDFGYEVDGLFWLTPRTLRMGGMEIPESTASPSQYTKLRLIFVPQE